jgi:hypothetical protein
MKTVPTYTATIYVGLKERATGMLVPESDAIQIIENYVDSVGLCVSVTPTRFVYTNGGEPGLIVGLINYPRFPSTSEHISQHAIALAEALRKGCKQLGVSIVLPDHTVWLDSDNVNPSLAK